MTRYPALTCVYCNGITEHEADCTRNVCPVGGEHVWTNEVDETLSTRGSLYYVMPSRRWHCEECGAPMPREDYPDDVE